MNFIRPIGAIGKNRAAVKLTESIENRLGKIRAKANLTPEGKILNPGLAPLPADKKKLLQNLEASAVDRGNDPKLLKGMQDYALGKRNLGIAGIGGAGLLGSNMLSHHMGYGSGDTEGFNRGGEAGWVGGQQAGMDSARKAYGDSGFLSRLMSSFSPNDPGAMQGSQFQAFNPQVSQGLKEISKAMRASGQKAPAAPAVR